MIYHIVTAANDHNPNLKAGLYSLHWKQLRARKKVRRLASVPLGTWPPEQVRGPMNDAAGVVDRILGYRIKDEFEVIINIRQCFGDANAEIDGSSSGLSYGLFIYDAIYQAFKGRKYEANQEEWVFATGKVEASGAITEVGDIFKKLKLVLEYLDKYDVEAVSFLYPISCEAAYHAAVETLKKEQGEQVVADKLKRFKCILGVSSLTQAVKALGIDLEAKEVSLFRGLQSFEFQDRTHFAGREQTTDAAINQLIKKLNDEQNKARSGVLLLTGLNGSGKSSLAKAGILPSLVEAADDRKHPHHVGDNVIYPKHGNSSQPLGTLPIQQGLSGFINAFVSFLTERVGLNIDGDAASIRTDPDSFITNVSQQLETQKDQSLVMVIDQLEEVFQWPGSEVWEKETTVCDASVFFDFINRLVSQCQGLIFITTLRSEFFSRFDRSYHFQKNSPERSTRETALTTFKNDSSQLFGVASDLNGEQWSAILSQQLEWAGLEETTESDHSKLRQTGRYIETRLVGDLLKDAMNESHALPLASFCLQYLYEEAVKRQQPKTPLVLTWRDYVGSIYADAEDKATKYQDRVGLGLIAKKAENILTQAFIQSGITTPTETEKSALASTFFMAFIEKSEDFEQLTKSRLSDEKLQALLKKRYKQGAKELTAFDLLLQGFIDSHLMIKEYHEGVTTYQIAHDALISRWQRVKQWFVDEKAFIVWFAQASTQFRLWEKSGQRKPLLEGSLLSGGKNFLKDSTKDLFELEGYVKRSLFNSRRNWTVLASAIAMVILAITILYTNAADERDRAQMLLASVRANLNYMNYELRDVLQEYVPINERMETFKQIDALNDSLLKQDRVFNPESFRARATSLQQKAETLLLHKNGNIEEALVFIKDAIMVGELLLSHDPDNMKWMRDLSVSFRSLAKIETELGNLDSASLAQTKSTRIVEKLVKLDPKRLDYKSELSFLFGKSGEIFQAKGDLEGAQDFLNKSLMIRLDLVKNEPENESFQFSLGGAYYDLASLARQMGEFEAALKYSLSNLRIWSGLSEKKIDNVDVPHSLAAGYLLAAHVKRRLNDFSEAEKLYQSGLKIRGQLLNKDPNNTGYLVQYAQGLALFGEFLKDNGDFHAALSKYRESKELASSLVKNSPTNITYTTLLIDIHNGTAEVAKDSVGIVFTNDAKDSIRVVSQKDVALEAYQASLSLSKELAFIAPNNYTVRDYLGNAYLNLGNLQRDLGNILAAKEMYETGLNIYEKLTEEAPYFNYLGRYLASQTGVGSIYMEQEHYEGAIQYFDSATETTKKILQELPNDLYSWQNSIFIYERLGYANVQTGRRNLALEAYTAGLRICERRSAKISQYELLQQRCTAINNGLESISASLEE